MAEEPVKPTDWEVKPEEKRLPHAKWELVEVTFTSVHTDKVIPHKLNPKIATDVQFEVMDRNVPGSIYRGVKAPQTDYIVLRSTETGSFHIRLYIGAHYEATKLAAISFTEKFARLVANNTFTGTNVFSGTGNEFQEILKVDKGLQFPATQVASSDANVLDDYEEGTWTPTIGGSGGQSGQAYSVQVGHYVKIGQQVTVWANIQLSTLGTITGTVQVQGLPFTTLTTTNFAPITNSYWGAMTSTLVNMVHVGAANTTVTFIFLATAAVAGLVASAQANFSNTTNIAFTISYRATA